MRNLELAADATFATDAAEVVSRTAAPTPPSTRAGGQDDGSYTNSLKILVAALLLACLQQWREAMRDSVCMYGCTHLMVLVVV